MKLISKIMIAFTFLLGIIVNSPQNVKAANNETYALIRTIQVDKTTDNDYNYHHLNNSLYYEIRITGEYSLVDGVIQSPSLRAQLDDYSTNNDTFQASVTGCSVTYTATTITAKVTIRYTKDGAVLGSTTKTVRVV